MSSRARISQIDVWFTTQIAGRPNRPRGRHPTPGPAGGRRVSFAASCKMGREGGHAHHENVVGVKGTARYNILMCKGCVGGHGRAVAILAPGGHGAPPLVYCTLPSGMGGRPRGSEPIWYSSPPGGCISGSVPCGSICCHVRHPGARPQFVHVRSGNVAFVPLSCARLGHLESRLGTSGCSLRTCRRDAPTQRHPCCLPGPIGPRAMTNHPRAAGLAASPLVNAIGEVGWLQDVLGPEGDSQ